MLEGYATYMIHEFSQILQDMQLVRQGMALDQALPDLEGEL